MKTKLFLLLSTVLLMTGLYSCKKKAKEPTIKELLTSGVWYNYESKKFDAQGNEVFYISVKLYYEFTPSGNFYAFTNSRNLIIYGKYEVIESDKKIIATPYQGTPVENKILEINENEMILRKDISDGYFIYKYKKE